MALAIIDLSFQKRLEVTSGAFPVEPSFGDQETSLALQSSLEMVFAASSQVQEIDLESTPSTVQELSPLKIETGASPKHGPRPIAVKVPFLLRWVFEEWCAFCDLFSLGAMVCALLILNLSRIIQGFFVFITFFCIARIRPHRFLKSDFTLLLCCMVWCAAFSVLKSLRKQVSQLINLPAGQRFLKRFYPSSQNLEAVHRKAYQVYCICVILGTWLLLVLIGLALAFTLVRFIVDLLSICMLLVAALWLLAILLMVHEMHNK